MKRNLTTAKKLSQSKTWLTAKPLLGKLIKWTTWAVLAIDVAIIILYAIGSYRKAPGTIQLFLVRACLILSLLLIISSVYGLILDLYYAIRRKQAMYLAGAAGYIILIALGIALALFSAFIIGAVDGNL